MPDWLSQSAWGWWLFCVGTLLFLELSVEIGYRLGHRRRSAADSEQRKSQVSTVLGGLLALFGFLLAISFNVAENRFSQRRALVLQEANAIGTTFLRTDFLPEPLRSEARNLLHTYAGLRLEATRTRDITRPIRRSEEIQTKIWSLAGRAGKNDPRSIPIGLFVRSLNEVIDLHQERITVALIYRLPPSLMRTLYLVGFLTLIAIGYYFGLCGDRNPFVTFTLVASLAAILLLNADIDQMRPRFFQITQRPMENTYRMIETSLRE